VVTTGTSAYDKLSKLDEAFLAFETPNTYMHVALTGIFEAGPLGDERGAVDLDRIRMHLASRLHLIPRYRQRLTHIPFINDAVWIDDDRFDLAQHVRHASLPRPGNEGQLQQRVAEILERPLNRARPLWEIWIIEGLADDRFALLTKVHHCMVDGVGGVEVLAVLFGPQQPEHPVAGTGWTPRPSPGTAQLVGDEFLRRGRRLLHAGRELRSAVRTPRRSAAELGRRATALASFLRSGANRPAPLPFNGPVGPHRRIVWQSTAMEDVSFIAKQLDATINDVVLTTVAGGLRRYLRRHSRGLPPTGLKVAVPVNVRATHERGRLGNRASVWIVPLPIDTADARRRLVKVRHETSRLKAENQKDGAELLSQAAEWTNGHVLHAGIRLIASASPYNLIVTNVPGPASPLDLLGARLVEAYPHVPLFENQGLGIALFSYNQRLYWGLTLDWDLVPDPTELLEDLRQSFAELHQAATTSHRRTGPAAGHVKTAATATPGAAVARPTAQRSREPKPPQTHHASREPLHKWVSTREA
jgi:diacylglycerol O-acyltransferase